MRVFYHTYHTYIFPLTRKNTCCQPLFSIICLTFLILITFAYPLIFLLPVFSTPYASIFCLFSIETVSAFSILMILLRWYKIAQLNLYASIALLALFFISIFQFLSISDYRFSNICFSLIWVSCPLAVYLYADKLKLLAIAYFPFLWIINCLQSLWQIYRKAELIGLPGNRNWHGAFLLATTPFMIYYLYSGLKKKNLPKKILIVISFIPAVISLIFLYLCHSRGASLALIITGLIAFTLYFPHLKKALLRRIMIYGIILTSLSFFFAGNRIADIIFQDIRIPYGMAH